MIVDLRTFKATYARDPRLRLGCVVDTNILFGASYPLDRLNTWSEKFVEVCRNSGIPLYTNLNVRAEYLDIYRRALAVESLLQIWSQFRTDLSGDTQKRLKALDQLVRENIQRNKTTLISERDIKEYKETLLQIFPVASSTGKDLWQILCEDFLLPQLAPSWDDVVDSLGLNFAGSRALEDTTLFTSVPNWADATKIIGKSCMGSMDAMIVNFFGCSKFYALVTADAQVAEYLDGEHGANRLIIFPDDEELS